MSRLASDSPAKVQSVGAFDAKTHLSRLLQRVEKGEQITITRHGRPVARLVPVEKRARRDLPALVEAFLAGTHKARLGPGLTMKELIAEGRRR